MGVFYWNDLLKYTNPTRINKFNTHTIVIGIISHDGVQLYNGTALSRHKLEEAIRLMMQHKLVFVNLQECGAILLKCLFNNNFLVRRVVVFNLTFYTIWVEDTVIKCYNRFEINVGCAKTIYEKILELDMFAVKFVGKTLYHYKINSLAGLGIALLKTIEGKNCFLKISEALEKQISAAVYGGRKEIYIQNESQNV
jgi:hypothetical protein